MHEKFPMMGIVTEKDIAVYKLRNDQGSYDEIPVSNHFFEMHGLKRYVEEIAIQSGLSVFLIDLPAEAEIEMEYTVNECPLAFGVTLECDMHSVYYKNGAQLMTEHKQPNTLIISKSNNSSGKSIKDKGKPVQVVSIAFDKNLAKVLFKNELSFIKPELEDFFQDNDHFYELTEHASPVQIAAARSIMSCSLASPKRELFIKSKVFELMNHIFSEFFLSSSDTSKRSVLQPGEVDKIKDIRDYISERIDTPPTINELARLSGINDFKLKAGFKEVFGTTVYGYIQSEKMTKAKLMLETGEHTVSEIAWTIGYTNVSHFIKAFKKHYNITPGQMLYHVKSDITQSRIKYSV